MLKLKSPVHNNKKHTNLTALLLGFAFLLAILVFNSLQNWQRAQQGFQSEVQQTLNNFANQSKLLAQASFRTNVIFTRSYRDLISQALENDHDSQQQLWTELQYAIFNLTGATLFDAQGQPKLKFGEPLSHSEDKDIWNNIHGHSEPQQAFSLRYGDYGGFFVYNAFYTADNELHYFVVRRSYSELSHIIYAGTFSDFELLLIDNRDDSIVMREGYFANSHNQPVLAQTEADALVYRVKLPYTRWDLGALPTPKPLHLKLWGFIWQPLLILSVFLIFAGLFAWRAQKNHLQAQQLRRSQQETKERGSQLLQVIQDAFITTDNLGNITFINAKAASLLRQFSHQDPLGQSLYELWDSPQALWNLHLLDPELNGENSPHLSYSHQGQQVIFAQFSSPLYEQGKITGYLWLLRDISAETLALKEAEASNKRYKALFDEASVAHCLFDIQHFKEQSQITLVRANEAAIKMTQAQSNEQLIDGFLLLTGKVDNAFNYYLKRALTLDLDTTEFELPITTFSGESRTLWATLSLRSEGDLQVLASFIDITEQKLNIQQTREREVFWNKVMDALPDLVYVVELGEQHDMNVIYHNRTMGNLLGHQDSAESGNDWMKYWARDLSDGSSERFSRAVERISQMSMGQTTEASARFRHADGSLRVIKFRDTPLSINQEGQVSRYIGTARDVTDEIERQELIVDSERRYRLLAENINDIIWATDVGLQFNFVSSSVKHILGYQPNELLHAGVQSIFRAREVSVFTKQIEEMLHRSKADAKHSLVKDLIATHKNGHEIVLEIQASPVFNDSGKPHGIVGTCRDVSEARQLERELHLAAEVFDKSNEGIIITDRKQQIVKTNTAICHLSGYQPERLLGEKPFFLISREHHSKEFIHNIEEILHQQGYWQGEITYRKANGHTRTAWAGISAVHDRHRTIQSLIVIISDITERKRSEERIRQLAYYDTLTGLANRSQLNERLSLMMEKASTYNQAVALLFIDLDRFKPINDTLGHPAGDAVLQEVAQRLRSCVKQNDFICRMGGDEFTLALDAQNKRSVNKNARLVAERILEVLHQPYFLGQHEVFISASIGVAIYPEHATSGIELIKRADMAMYHAKETGRNNVQFFDQSMSEQALEQLLLENDIRHALERDQLELYYQPQYAAASVKPLAAEALLRWHHPEKGLMPPSIFIPIIEDTGLINSIGKWVLNQACQQFAQWKRQGIQLERIAVNVSARQFKQADFVNIVLQAIEDAGMYTYELELEITESILIDDVEHTLNTLNSLRKIGVRTAIDDFGTGYSSLNYLKQFPVDTLKIDRSFVQGLPHNADDAQIAHTIIAMAHNLGMGVIAEGVETHEQHNFLIKAQCEEVQGFLFSKPLPAAECFIELNADLEKFQALAHNERISSST